MKEYRRHIYLNQLSNRLNRRLYSIVILAKGNRGRGNIKKVTVEKAEKVLDNFSKLLVDYVYRTRIKGKVKNPVDIDRKKLQELNKQKIEDFKEILNDVL